VIARRDHPKLIGAIDRQVRNGTLRPVLPGVYAAPETCESVQTRILALMRWDPDAILIGPAAAWTSFWPEIRMANVTCSLRHQRRPQHGYDSREDRFQQSWSSTGRDYASPPQR
jgi:hypothetical protein